MKLKRIIAGCISEGFFFINKLQGYQKGLRILLYHSIGTKLPHDSYGISIKKELFIDHMVTLKKMEGIRIVNLSKECMSDTTFQIAITFDDGYKDNLYTATPILLKHHIPFTVFVTTSFIQSGLLFYLNPKELRELASLNGVSIGSHGVTHTSLAQCDDSTLWQELYDSKSYLEDLIGKAVTAISYPHGSVNRRVRDVAEKAGYVIGGSSIFGVNKLSQDTLLLHRTEILASDSERIFLQKVLGAWDWYGWYQRSLLTL